MKYYNYEQREKVLQNAQNKKLDEVLQKYFPENDKNYWEVYSLFNGEKEDELWIFHYYKKFGDAVRRVKLGIEKLKPIWKY